jgi:excisionase family DNA binding protein
LVSGFEVADACLPLLSVLEVARRLNVATSTVYKICAEGKLPHARVSNAIRVPEAAGQQRNPIGAETLGELLSVEIQASSREGCGGTSLEPLIKYDNILGCPSGNGAGMSSACT